MKPSSNRDPELDLWDQKTEIFAMNSLKNRSVYFLIIFFFLSSIFIIYTKNLRHPSLSCILNVFPTQSETDPYQNLKNTVQIMPNTVQTSDISEKTELRHIAFGIAASAKNWERRKKYVKLWWRPGEMRGFVWLDQRVALDRGDLDAFPLLRVSDDTSNFKYTYRGPGGHRSGIRISRIVSETLRQGLKDVRWFVMGDDDTVFLPDNLVRVLAKYNHRDFYYIGASSESHLQNINFTYNMAYGGGGFAISYPLAKALEKMQDRCIKTYPHLFGSDDRIQACMAELGVPLTREVGFHQFDIFGSPFGLLAAHPIAPLVSLHHLDVVDSIFPNADRVQALERLKIPMKLDSAALAQQSICHDRANNWTISVSWGYAVQIYRGIHPAREMEIPTRTFLNWYQNADQYGFAFNTKPVNPNPCQRPVVFILLNAAYNPFTNQTVSAYARDWASNPKCKRKKPDPSSIIRVVVFKKPDPDMWDKAPRRNCCRTLASRKKNTVEIEVEECREDEIVQL
ncbi:O-fucosylpeptide 3-beta-N-acetylglucosaminyltransferase [Bertholletia excelsa]